MKGIIYTTTGQRDRAVTRNYHNSPDAINHSIGAKDVDVKNIKSKVKSTCPRNTNYRSNYTIGFEIEKSRFDMDFQREYALLKGYEYDGSCGVEAITNILPLLPPSQWRNKIFDMIYKAKGIIDDETSPSNYDCGGHTTLQVDGVLARDLYKGIRLNASILMAMFRYRLKNEYCRYNLRMEYQHHIGSEGQIGDTPSFNGGIRGRHWHHKYQFCLLKNVENLIEFRVPSRITSYKQLFRRYEVMYEIVDFSITKPNGRFSSLLNKVRPIVLSMYGNDAEKTDMVLSLAKDFRSFIKDGRISNSIREFLI